MVGRSGVWRARALSLLTAAPLTKARMKEHAVSSLYGTAVLRISGSQVLTLVVCVHGPWWCVSRWVLRGEGGLASSRGESAHDVPFLIPGTGGVGGGGKKKQAEERDEEQASELLIDCQQHQQASKQASKQAAAAKKEHTIAVGIRTADCPSLSQVRGAQVGVEESRLGRGLQAMLFSASAFSEDKAMTEG
jgi:hypothetical protein